MSGPGFDSLGFDSLGFDTGGTGSSRYPGPAGGVGYGRGGKKKKWILGDRQVIATREELEAELTEMLQAAPAEVIREAPKVAAKDKAIVATFPAYPDIRDMLLAAQQIEAAQVLRAVAQRLADAEDEDDVEMILLWG